MDGFDDLLSHSRSPLENPFEDPFARSNSPDPWATFGQSSTLHDETTAVAHSDQTALIEVGTESSSSLSSPGFRTSTPTTTEPLTQPEETQFESTPSSPSRELSTSPALPATAPPTSSRTESTYRTPLDESASANLEGSVAGLAIGGESIGGWQGSQSASVGATRAPSLRRDRSDSDSSDDDRPILQSARLSANRDPSIQAGRPMSTPRNDTGLRPVFVITVDDPQKVGDPIRAYTMYTVHAKTTSPLFSKSSFSVLRRYSDFLWLYETLSQNSPGVVVPPVPEKNPYRRFDENFVQQRRLALEKCIQKIANHPVLQKDPDLKLFLESDTFALDIKHRKADLAHEKGGLMASIGQSIAGPRFYETDEWFDRQKGYLDSLEAQLRGLVKSIDLVAKHRSELSVTSGEFAQTVADLSASDVGSQLSSSFTWLAEVQRKAQELQTLQSREDVVTIMATVDEYARLINSVRLAFSSRIRIHHTWQSADSNLKRVKHMHETNRAQGRLPSDQLSRSLSLVADAERRALDAKQEFDQVSKLVKAEVARFEHERIEDFKNSLEAFLEGMISKQKQLIVAWEGYQQKLLKIVATPDKRPHENIAVPPVL